MRLQDVSKPKLPGIFGRRIDRSYIVHPKGYSISAYSLMKLGEGRSMGKYRNEALNRVLMSRKSVVFKDKKHPTRQKLKQQLKKRLENNADE